MKKVFLLAVFVAPFMVSYAQSTKMEDSLQRQLATATTLEERIRKMSDLAKFYLSTDNTKSEEYGSQIIAIADSSRNREMMALAYLENADRCFNLTAIKEYADRGIDYTNKALEIARNYNLTEYQAWGYSYLARGLRTSGEIDKALNYNIQAVSIAATTKNDSLKVSVIISLGNTYMQKDEKLLAFRNYLEALNIAEETNKYSLLVNAYGRMSFFYAGMEEYEKAKDYEFRKERLQREKDKKFGLLDTYSTIGTLYLRAKQYDLAKKYYEKVIALSDSLEHSMYKLSGYLQIVTMYMNSNEYKKGLEYFNAHPEVKESLIKSGLTYLVDHAYGSIYTMTGALDSAQLYFIRAEPEFESKANLINKFYFYINYATYFKARKDYDQSITYWLKARDMGDKLGSLDIQQLTVTNLDTLYQLKGDYKNAHLYSSLYAKMKDSLQKLSREKDMLSLEIDSENRRKEREALRQQQETNRRHNIQYMGIVVAIAAIFILLVMAGVFSVSKNAIHVLGFFAFIFLFEFIILLADNQIHHWTHGEPWKVLAIKIALIAMLLPLHHWLEKKVIHYLTTQELLKVKGKGIVGKWFRKKDADLPLSNM